MKEDNVIDTCTLTLPTVVGRSFTYFTRSKTVTQLFTEMVMNCTENSYDRLKISRVMKYITPP